MIDKKIKTVNTVIKLLLAASIAVLSFSVTYLYGFVHYRRYYYLDFDTLTIISAAFLTCTLLLGSEYIYLTSKNKRLITKSIIHSGYEFIVLAAYNLFANILVLLAFYIRKEDALACAYFFEGMQILTVLAYISIFSKRRKDFRKKLKLCSFKFAQPQYDTLVDSSDSVQAFMNLLTKKTNEESVNLLDLQDIYQLWCSTNEYEALDEQAFKARIKELRYKLVAHYDGVYVYDIELLESY